jgi:hypothetical protein
MAVSRTSACRMCNVHTQDCLQALARYRASRPVYPCGMVDFSAKIVPTVACVLSMLARSAANTHQLAFSSCTLQHPAPTVRVCEQRFPSQGCAQCCSDLMPASPYFVGNVSVCWLWYVCYVTHRTLSLLWPWPWPCNRTPGGMQHGKALHSSSICWRLLLWLWLWLCCTIGGPT